LQLPVRDVKGSVLRTIEVSDDVYGVEMNGPLVHQIIVGHLANRRVGTHSTKTRAEVRGGGRKPWRQKGTGRARQGSIRSPQWRGGGIVHGPKPRDYHQRLPKKMRRSAIKCLLSDKVRGESFVIVDEIVLNEYKTKEMVSVLEQLGLSGKSLVVSSDPNQGLGRACRNLPRVKSLPVATINALDLINYENLLITESAVRKVEDLWGNKASVDLDENFNVTESKSESEAS
jgi:large subunit ribosomal protein L4